MNTEIINKLEAKFTGLYPTHQHFIENVPCYEIILGDIKVYFSELNIMTGEDLRSKDLISFYMIRGCYASILMISTEMMLNKKFVFNAIKNSFKDVHEKAI